MTFTQKTTTSGEPALLYLALKTPSSLLISAPEPTIKPFARCQSHAVSSLGESNSFSIIYNNSTDLYPCHSVHPILRRLEEFADLPLVPALLATIHEQSSEDLMKYKLAPICGFSPLGTAELSAELES